MDTGSKIVVPLLAFSILFNLNLHLVVVFSSIGFDNRAQYAAFIASEAKKLCKL